MTLPRPTGHDRQPIGGGPPLDADQQVIARLEFPLSVEVFAALARSIDTALTELGYHDVRVGAGGVVTARKPPRS